MDRHTMSILLFDVAPESDQAPLRRGAPSQAENSENFHDFQPSTAWKNSRVWHACPFFWDVCYASPPRDYTKLYEMMIKTLLFLWCIYTQSPGFRKWCKTRCNTSSQSGGPGVFFCFWIPFWRWSGDVFFKRFFLRLGRMCQNKVVWVLPHTTFFELIQSDSYEAMRNRFVYDVLTWWCVVLTLFNLFRSEFLSKCHRIHGVLKTTAVKHLQWPTAWSPKIALRRWLVCMLLGINQKPPREFFCCWNFCIGLVLASTAKVMLDSLPNYEMCGARGHCFMQFGGSGSNGTKLREFTFRRWTF